MSLNLEWLNVCQKISLYKEIMRIVIQRVTEASVVVENKCVGAIGKGLMILVGVETGDTREDVQWLAEKTAGLRIFARVDADDDRMDASVLDIGGEVLAISQFTLTASTRKGKRPSYIRAARGDEASELYDYFCELMSVHTGKPTARGIFGADMKVKLVNDGPVTIIIDSRLRE